MYEAQTYDVILSRMLSALPVDIDKREGSVAYDMLAPKAAELAMAYLELDNVLKFGFVDTTYGSFLDSKVSESGIIRNPALKAIGKVTFTGAVGTTIAANTTIYTNNMVKFTTDVAVTIPVGGSIDVKITALIEGVSGNVAANSIVNIDISGITVTNVAPTDGGRDLESDASVLDRYYKKIQKPSTSGNAADYYTWAMTVNGIGDAKVIPLWNGPGTVKVVIISTSKQPVTPEKVLEVGDYINIQKPIGATSTVESAINKVINIEVDLTLQEGATITMIQPLVVDKISKYFEDAAFVDADIKAAKIGALILDVEGVLDYMNLKLNGSTSNVVLSFNEVPSLGTVTL